MTVRSPKVMKIVEAMLLGVWIDCCRLCCGLETRAAQRDVNDRTEQKRKACQEIVRS